MLPSKSIPDSNPSSQSGTELVLMTAYQTDPWTVARTGPWTGLIDWIGIETGTGTVTEIGTEIEKETGTGIGIETGIGTIGLTEMTGMIGCIRTIEGEGTITEVPTYGIQALVGRTIPTDVQVLIGVRVCHHHLQRNLRSPTWDPKRNVNKR